MMVSSQWPVAPECLEDQRDLRVKERDAGMVGLHVITPQGVVLDAQLEPELLVAAALRDLGSLFPEIRAGGRENQVLARIHLEVGVRGKKGHVGLLDAADHEEGFLSESPLFQP